MQRRQNHVRVTRRNRNQLSQQYIDANNIGVDVDSFKHWVKDFYVNQYLGSRVILARRKREQITAVLAQLDKHDFGTIGELLDASNSALKNALFGRRMFRRSVKNSWGKSQILMHFVNPENQNLEQARQQAAAAERARQAEEERLRNEQYRLELARQEQARREARRAQEEKAAQALREAQAILEASRRQAAEEQARKAAETEARLRAEAELRRQAEEKRARELAAAEAKRRAELEQAQKEAAERRKADEARRQEESRKLRELAEQKLKEEAAREAKLKALIAEHSALHDAFWSNRAKGSVNKDVFGRDKKFIGDELHAELAQLNQQYEALSAKLTEYNKVLDAQNPRYINKNEMQKHLDTLKALDYNSALAEIDKIRERLNAINAIYVENYRTYESNVNKIDSELEKLRRTFGVIGVEHGPDFTSELKKNTCELILEVDALLDSVDVCMHDDKVAEVIKRVQAQCAVNKQFIDQHTELAITLINKFEVYASLIALLPLAEESATKDQINHENRAVKEFRKENIHELVRKFSGCGAVETIQANTATIDSLLENGFEIYPEIHTHYQEAKRIANELIELHKAKSDKLDFHTAAFIASCKGNVHFLIRTLNEYAAHHELLFTTKEIADKMKLGGKDDQPPSPKSPKQPPLAPMYMYVYVYYPRKKAKSPPADYNYNYSDMFKWALFNRVINEVNGRTGNNVMERTEMVRELNKLGERYQSFEQLVERMSQKIQSEMNRVRQEQEHQARLLQQQQQQRQVRYNYNFA